MTEDELTAIRGIGPDYAERLRASGFESLDDLRETKPADLEAVDGVGPERAVEILAAVEELDEGAPDVASLDDSDGEADPDQVDVEEDVGESEASTMSIEPDTADSDVEAEAPVRARIEPHVEYVAPGVWTDTPGTPMDVEWSAPLGEAIKEGRARPIRYHYADGSTETVAEE